MKLGFVGFRGFSGAYGLGVFRVEGSRFCGVQGIRLHVFSASYGVVCKVLLCMSFSEGRLYASH